MTAPYPIPVNNQAQRPIDRAPAEHRQVAQAPIAHSVDQGPMAIQQPPARKRRSWLSLAASWLVILSTTALLAFVAIERDQVARAVPGAAGVYAAVGLTVNPHGLMLRNVVVDWVEEDNQQELEVRGEVHNLLGEERRVPSIVVTVRDRAGASLFHTVAGVGSGRISRGGFTRFTTRIPSPPPGTASVAVHFPAPK
jgi:hypothetical protein